MASGLTPSPILVTRRIEEVSGIRPVTLLIASGIALIIAILIATGTAAIHLREQALAAAESDLVRVDSLLAEATNRSMAVVDGRLTEVAGRLGAAASGAAAGFRRAASAPEIGVLLRRELGRFPPVDAMAVITADGVAVNRAGAWPAGDAARHDLIAALQQQPARASVIGATLRDLQTGVARIPLVRRIDGPAGVPIGAVVTLIPAAEFTSLFAAIPLPPATVIALRRPDGSTLARYPEQVDGSQGSLAGTSVDAILGDVTATMIRHFLGTDGKWQIVAVRSLAGFRAAVVVTRGADRVLADWAYQGLWYAAFALGGAVAIAVMVYLIARQFQAHATLAAMRADKIEAEKIEIERARLAAEAELLKGERLSVLGQLTATVAHDLRNPLSVIRKTLFTVKELATAAGVKLDRPIARMERSIERCDRIISDLLEYTRNRELNRTSIRFDLWLANILAEQSVAPPIVIAPKLGAGDAALPLDHDRFRRVVINLVENAAQALAETPPDREKHIVVRTSIVDRELALVVEDTGPGIKPENLGRIFEPLFSTKSFGTGLGLPTVKQIVNQHGGMIAVGSEVGRGTCVTVRLPLPGEQMDVVKVAA